MRSKYHILITKEAIGTQFSRKNLNTIIVSNVNQDGIIGLLAHDEFHFDNNKFLESNNYIEDQRYLCIQAINESKQRRALKAFGRLCHTVQDFYAHSNFIQIWINNLHGKDPDLNKLDCLDNDILTHPALATHQTIFPGDYLALIPGITKFLKPYLPENSHTKMNLDSPESGANFALAYHAAVKRTKFELDRIIKELSYSNNEIDLFLGRDRFCN